MRLHRVLHQVDEHLLELLGVAVHPGQRLGQLHLQLDAPGMSFWMSRTVRVTTSLRSVGPKLCLSGRE